MTNTESHLNQDGFILLAATALLSALLIAVLICFFPLASYDARTISIHRDALRLMKTAERGFFGRLADQPGGLESACGGYFSDMGSKVVTGGMPDLISIYGGPADRTDRAMEFWYYRRVGGDICAWGVSTGNNGFAEGCNDVYRYDPDNGFWAGYRGKRYVVRPAGKEHYRNQGKPMFPIGEDGDILFQTNNGQLNVTNMFLRDDPGQRCDETQHIFDYRLLDPCRYFNPVERLVIKVNDHRNAVAPLYAELVYAKQVDNWRNVNGEWGLNMVPTIAPQPKVITETPYRQNSSARLHIFVFRWDTEADKLETVTDMYGNAVPNVPGQLVPWAHQGHTFEIGLKKLVLFDNDPNQGGVPVYSCGITIPPAREYQGKGSLTVGAPADRRVEGNEQQYSDQYVIELDYYGPDDHG